MNGWYPYFVGAVVLLWAVSSPRDRKSLRIILAATIFSFLITEGVTRHIVWAGKLIVPATVESLTILALLHFSPNRTAYTQAGLLGIAWGAHLICYYDLMTGSNVVYDNYSNILFWVAVGQIAACYDTFRHNWISLCDAVLRWTRPDNLSAGRGASVGLHSSGRESLPPL